MQVITKEELIAELQAIRARGWIRNARPGNHGGVGNTLEDLLGIQENNLPIPNAAEWELKCQRSNTTSLVTLFHTEPSPTAMRLVPNLLLPKYGWSHQEAGKKYQASEMSFRQTITGSVRSDRGFKVVVDRTQRRVEISFDASAVSASHALWLEAVRTRAGNLNELNPQPYWGFDDLMHKAGTKLLNAFFVQADVRKEDDVEYYHYAKIMQLQKFDIDRLLSALERGLAYIDFDARTGHNHGTKFRIHANAIPSLYDITLNL